MNFPHYSFCRLHTGLFTRQHFLQRVDFFSVRRVRVCCQNVGLSSCRDTLEGSRPFLPLSISWPLQYYTTAKQTGEKEASEEPLKTQQQTTGFSVWCCLFSCVVQHSFVIAGFFLEKQQLDPSFRSLRVWAWCSRGCMTPSFLGYGFPLFSFSVLITIRLSL